MATHALVVGNAISGRIPISHEAFPQGHVDVSPYVLYFEHDDATQPPDSVKAVADAIEAEHFYRGTHPVQLACEALDDPEQYPNPPAELVQAHKDEHAALAARLGGK